MNPLRYSLPVLLLAALSSLARRAGSACARDRWQRQRGAGRGWRRPTRRNLPRRGRAHGRGAVSRRVVRTDVEDEDGRKVYVLKLLSEDGRVITVRIDAATGRMR